MKDIVNKLECIVFVGIIPLRNEKKRRKEWKKGCWKGRNLQELMILDKKGLLKPEESIELQQMKKRMEKKDWGFWIIYWFFMPVLHVELIILLFVVVISESMRTIHRKLRKNLTDFLKKIQR